MNALRWIALLGSLATVAAPLLAADRAAFPSENHTAFLYNAVEDDQGGFHVTWTHSEGTVYSLIAQHLNPDGVGLWDGGKVVAQNINAIENWATFADGQGGLVVIWIETGQVFAQRWDASGKDQWPKNPLGGTDPKALLPAGVADAAGGAFVVWSEQKPPDRWVLKAQHLDRVGSPLWPVGGQRVSTRPSDQRRASVISDGSSGCIVAWKDFRENASQVQAQRLNHQGNRLWTTDGVVITAPAGAPRESPTLQPLGSGGAVFAWSGRESATNRLLLQAVDGSGRFRWAAKGISVNYGTWDQWNPALFGDGRGALWAAWEDYRNQSHWQVFVGKLDAQAHQRWPGGELPLAPFYADQGHVSLADDGRQGVFAAWLDNRSGSVGIYAQEVTADGKMLMGDTGLAVAGRLTNPTRPTVVPLAPGRAAIVWSDRLKKDRWGLGWKVISGPAMLPQSIPAKSTSTVATPEPTGEGMVYP